MELGVYISSGSWNFMDIYQVIYFFIYRYLSISRDQVRCYNLLQSNTMGVLTHWGRVTHICVGNLTIIGPDNGLSPGRRQAIIWTNAGILLIGPCGTNFSEILIGIQTFSLKKCIWKCCLRNGVYFVSASMCFNESWKQVMTCAPGLHLR